MPQELALRVDPGQREQAPDSCTTRVVAVLVCLPARPASVARPRLPVALQLADSAAVQYRDPVDAVQFAQLECSDQVGL